MTQMIVRSRRYRRPALTLSTLNNARKLVNAVKSSYKSYSKYKPSRNRVSKTRTKQTRKTEQVLKNFAGSKYSGTIRDCDKPKPKPSGSQPISYHWYNSGKDISSVGGSYVNYSPLDLFNFPQGDSSTQRIGDYMYIRHSKIKLEIQALPIEATGELRGQQPVLQFRVMVIKSNRKYNSLGDSNDPGKSLYLDTTNGQFGYGVQGTASTNTTFENFSQPINKRDWLVYKDQRFKLSAPAVGSIPLGNVAGRDNTAYPKYNTKKYMSITLPVSKKTHFDDKGRPDNLDTQWLIIVQCTHGSYCTEGTKAPENYAINLLGTTSAYDN